ncbi:MAG: hypothetical protein ACI97B_004836 [Verrucomicrobiales bacterium]|jgi:hypothetical protein
MPTVQTAFRGPPSTRGMVFSTGFHWCMILIISGCGYEVFPRCLGLLLNTSITIFACSLRTLCTPGFRGGRNIISKRMIRCYGEGADPGKTWEEE